jgi:hypothetical protein
LEERELCTFTSYSGINSSRYTAENTMQKFGGCSQNRLLFMKTENITGKRRTIGHNDIYTIVLSDTMRSVSAIRENDQAGILKHFKI